jgi:hypothetical protein
VSESSSAGLKSAAAESPRTISHQQIAELAHSYWSGRNYTQGSPEEDWLLAERQLTGAASN